MVSGFIDGEGSFIFMYDSKRQRLFPKFSISQKNIITLNKIKNCFPELKWNIGKSPSNSAYALSVKGFTQCIKLFAFFDEYMLIEKDSQYKIWKFLIIKLAKENYDWKTKEKIWNIYKTKKDFGGFINEFKKL